MADPLAHRVSAGASAPEIAAAIVDTWLAVEAVLMPIIGPAGVAALFRRSAHLCTPAHPWLADAREGTSGAVDTAALKSLLLLQNAADALAGGRAMLQTFHGLLVGLVGASLTEQLLLAVWHPPSGAPPVQDISL